LRIPVIVKSGRSEFTLFPGKKIQVLALKTENTISINTENSYISLKKNKSL
jgi:hypothetical protein